MLTLVPRCRDPLFFCGLFGLLQLLFCGLYGFCGVDPFLLDRGDPFFMAEPAFRAAGTLTWATCCYLLLFSLPAALSTTTIQGFFHAPEEGGGDDQRERLYGAPDRELHLQVKRLSRLLLPELPTNMHGDF